MSKPIKAKPNFYALCFERLKDIAKEHGYNLVLHGSLDRDMDLIAIAWADNVSEHYKVLDDFCKYLGVLIQRNIEEEPEYNFSILPGNRSSYVINLNRGGKFNNYVDEQYYLDISFTPYEQK